MKQSAFDCARKNTIRDSSHFFTTLFSEPITNNYMKIDIAMDKIELSYNKHFSKGLKLNLFRFS